MVELLVLGRVILFDYTQEMDVLAKRISCESNIFHTLMLMKVFLAKHLIWTNISQVSLSQTSDFIQWKSRRWKTYEDIPWSMEVLWRGNHLSNPHEEHTSSYMAMTLWAWTPKRPCAQRLQVVWLPKFSELFVVSRELEADESYIIIYLKDQKILANQPQQVFETSREWQEKVQQKKKTSDQGVVTYFLVYIYWVSWILFDMKVHRWKG